jgi:hypothetical protein
MRNTSRGNTTRRLQAATRLGLSTRARIEKCPRTVDKFTIVVQTR